VDSLTGLKDASEFFAALPALSPQDRVHLVLFDVDELAELNERYGIDKVDRLLARFGALVGGRCGAAEICARIGGDEFALCLLEDETSEVVEEVGRIRERFSEDAGGATLSVGICGGSSLRRGRDRVSLFEAAQDALDEAKKRGPAGLSVFRPR